MSELSTLMTPAETLAPLAPAHEVAPELVAEIEAALSRVDEAFEAGVHTIPETLKDITRDSKDPQGHDGKRELYR